MKSDIGHKIPEISCVIRDIKNSIHIPNLRSLKFESRSHECSGSANFKKKNYIWFNYFDFWIDLCFSELNNILNFNLLSVEYYK